MTFQPHIDDRVSPDYARPTEPQLDYIRGMQKKLRLSDRLLDAHCEARFGSTRDQLDRRQASGLIDEMRGWESLPPEIYAVTTNDGPVRIGSFETAAAAQAACRREQRVLRDGGYAEDVTAIEVEPTNDETNEETQ